MNIWKHCILSQRKFGGQPEDYFEIHKFIDSSKLFLFHMKHRILLHNLLGVELCIEMYGDCVKNSDNKTVLVRDISVEHCKEDLSGFTPTLNDWFDDFPIPDNFLIPSFTDNELTSFVQRPYLRSGLKSSLIITCSNFGVFLVEKLYGVEKALLLANSLPAQQTVQTLLSSFKFTHTWQVFPDRKELIWLQQNEHNG